MWKNICWVFVAFVASYSPCISQVTIKGRFKNIKEKQQVYYFNPLGGYHNIYYDAIQIYLTNNDSFYLRIPTSEPCFINIKLPVGNGIIYLFTSPGDTITINASFEDNNTSKNTLTTLDFGGNNAAGHYLYTTIKSQFNQQYLIKNIFPEGQFSNVNEFLENCLLTIDTVALKFSSLVSENKISRSYSEHVLMDLIGYDLAHIFAVFQSFVIKNSTEDKTNLSENTPNNFQPNKALYTKENYDSIKLVFYKKYPPTDSSFATTGLGLLYVEDYYKDIYQGLLKSDIPYDSSFQKLCEDCKYFGYMRGKILEYKWAKTLHWVAITEVERVNLESNINAFEKYFPNSILLPYLKERYTTALANVDSSVNESREIDFLSSNYSTLKSLVTTNFRGKYVFIDLWAQWCSPCVQEFMYKVRLDSLLKVKGISILYISIDKESEREKWREFVKYKKLYGTHYLASDVFNIDIKKLIYKSKSVTIPRYLLVNPNGKIVGSDLSRPSNIQNLEKELSILISKE